MKKGQSARSANSLCQVFVRINDEAGLDRAISHSGRRSLIMTLAHTGVNVRVPAERAGHGSMRGLEPFAAA